MVAQLAPGAVAPARVTTPPDDGVSGLVGQGGLRPDCALMFERMTEPARAAVLRAAGRAGDLGQHRIGTEHLLWGLAELEHTHAGSGGPLTDAGVDHDALDTAVAQVRRDDDPADADRLPFSVRAQAALEAAPGIADGGGQSSVTAVHVLTALLADRSCRAAALLAGLGIDLDRLARRLTRSDTNP